MRRADGQWKQTPIAHANHQWNSCHLARDLTPDTSKYPGWRYNNIQPVTRSDGSNVDGMLLFYGWKDKNAPEAKAFLLHEEGDNK